MSKKIAQTAKKLARWYAHESLGQRKGVIVKDQKGSQSRGSRPGDTQIVLVLGYLFTLGLNDWLLAGGGLEALFVGMKEGHGM